MHLPAEQARIVQLLVERVDVEENTLEVRILMFVNLKQAARQRKPEPAGPDLWTEAAMVAGAVGRQDLAHELTSTLLR